MYLHSIPFLHIETAIEVIAFIKNQHVFHIRYQLIGWSGDEDRSQDISRYAKCCEEEAN